MIGESDELKSARTRYLAKLTKYGALPMPATAHYTAGYKDGSDMLWAIAQNCAEVERRLEQLTKQRDLAVSALEKALLTVPAVQDGGGFIIDHHSPDGEYIGSQNIDPMWVVQEMATIAHNALAAIKESEV